MISVWRLGQRSLTGSICSGVVAFALWAMALPSASQSFELTNSPEWPITDFTNRSVEFSEILSGGPPKDGIPSIDEPVFVTASDVEDWLADNEPVIALAHGDEAKAYPLQILTWHEIVNDKIGERPVTVTFCPLCNASIVFDRTIDGVVYDFGTTGRLRLSDMVMYDRQTESWWQQFTGEGIIGKMNGVTMLQVPSTIVSFATFREQYPDGKVLSLETGYKRNYGRNPYPGYDDINASPFLFRGKTDDRLPPMERVLSVRIEETTQLFALSDLAVEPVVNTEVGGQNVVVFAFEEAASALDKRSISKSRAIPAAAAFEAKLNNRSLTFELKDGQAVDRETGSRWSIFGIAEAGPLAGKSLSQIDGGVHFAFAWLAFDPQAGIFKP